MTKEEKELTITYLTEMQEEYIEGEGYERHPLPEYYALDMAIKALEQEPCEDAISREAMLNYQQYLQGRMSNEENHKLWEFIKDLPSVMPKPKIGKWIAQEDELGEYASGCFECSNCHEVFWVESGTPQDNEYNYCPNCGADMRGDSE